MPFLQTLGGGSFRGFQTLGGGTADDAATATSGGYEMFYEDGTNVYKVHIFNYDYDSANKFGGNTLTVTGAIDAEIMVIGGGGGGASFGEGVSPMNANGGAAGGGGGGIAVGTRTLSAGTISVTVGQGGNGGAGTYSGGSSPNNGLAGTTGGTSTFMDLQATGGQGGQVRGYSSNQVWEGTGSDGTAGAYGGNGGVGSSTSGLSLTYALTGGAGGHAVAGGMGNQGKAFDGQDGACGGGGGGSDAADQPGRAGNGTVNLLGFFGGGGGGGGAIDYGGSPGASSGGMQESNHNINFGGEGFRHGGHGGRISGGNVYMRPRDGHGPYGGEKGGNWDQNRCNSGSGGGMWGGGGGGASDEGNSQISHDGGQGGHGAVIVRILIPAEQLPLDVSVLNGRNGGSQSTAFHSCYECDVAGASNGLKWFKNIFGSTKEVYTYNFSTSSPNTSPVGHRGHYMLCTANKWNTSTIPGGQNKSVWSYTVDRTPASNKETTNLGTPDPNNDYIIGAWANGIMFGKLKGFGWGRGSTDNSKTFPGTLGEWAEINYYGHNFTHGTAASNLTKNYSTGSNLIANANWITGDGVFNDYGFNANTNQATVGMTGTNGQSSWAGYNKPDPSTGTYWGHGTNEGNGEGWYRDGSNADAEGFTMWVR